MKKILLLISLLIGLRVSAQQTSWTFAPTGSSSFTPTNRTIAGDSLHKKYFIGFSTTDFQQFPTWAQMRFAIAGAGGGTTTFPLTVNSSGAGDASSFIFNGAVGRTLSWNSIGAQPTLVSGTNIKTINGASLLGSSNILLQTPLVAGTDYLAPNGNGSALTSFTSGQITTALGFTPVNIATPQLTSSSTLNYVWTATGTTGFGSWQPATGSLTTANFVYNEIPSGTINGSNVTFTLANTPTSGTVRLFKNGLRLTPTTDYTLSGSTITYTIAPSNTGYTDVLLADYLK